MAKAKTTARYPYRDGSIFIRNIPLRIKPIFNYHLGGTFTRPTFDKLVNVPDFSGIMLWFCYDDATAQIFLAIESKTNFVYPKKDEQAVANLQPIGTGMNGNLFIPTQFFGQKIDDVTEVFLRSHTLSGPTTDDELDLVSVGTLNKKFLGHPLLGPHQKYGHAYFENTNNEVVDFINQADVRYIRYYFGYDSMDKPNYIRVILVPVDRKGKSIEIKLDRVTGADLLQKSWPPPPSN